MDTKTDFIKVIKEHEGLTTLYTDNHNDRNDLYQEIIYQLYKSFPTFNAQSKLSTWMYRVALNTAIYSLKQTKRSIRTLSIDHLPRGLTEDIDTDEEERIKLLYELIQLLSLLEKGIIILYLEGKNHEEIASIVGISVSNVGTRISRIKEKLKTQIIKTNSYGT